MTRTTALSLAAAFGFAATLTAQTTSTTTQNSRMNNKSAHEITITGCLSKGADGNYLLTNAREDKSSTTTGTTGTTTGTTTASGTTTAASPADHAMTWKLEGGSDLDRHIGHKIQVTGRTTWSDSMDHRRPDPNPDSTTTNPPTTTGTTGTLTDSEPQRRSATTTDASQPKLDVTSVKMIASSCS